MGRLIRGLMTSAGIGAALAAGPLGAQSVVLKHQFRPGDTLRYAIDSRDSTETNIPGEGVRTQVYDARALLRLRVDPNELATSWLDSLVFVVVSRRGRITPDAHDLLGRQIDLKLAPNGQMTVKKAPSVPDDLQPYMPDISTLFNGLLPALPGRSVDRTTPWTDTTVERLKTKRLSGKLTSVGSWKIVGDTTIDGQAAVRIEGTLNQRVEMIGDLGIEGITMRGDFTGPGRAAYLFVPGTGRVLWFDTSSAMRGDVVSVGSGEEVRVSQRFWTRQTLALQPSTH